MNTHPQYNTPTSPWTEPFQMQSDRDMAWAAAKHDAEQRPTTSALDLVYNPDNRQTTGKGA